MRNALPDLRAADVSPVVAVLGADFHMSDVPPTARSGEEEWLRAQAGYWRQVCRVCSKHGDIPFIGAGDFFDDGWRARRCSPALINMVLRNLPPRCYGIPGQHDLPNHRLDQVKRSAYWTLVEAGKLIPLLPGKPVEVSDGLHTPLRLYGFPWGTPVSPLEHHSDFCLEVAVVHTFVWTKTTGYPGAPADGRLKRFQAKAGWYDVAVTGDNHRQFQCAADRTGSPHLPLVFNAGGFMRRRSDEKDFRPRLGLLRSDGTITSHYLNTSKDVFTDNPTGVKEPPVEVMMRFVELLKELRGVGDKVLDFQDFVLRWMDKEGVEEGVRRAVLESLGGER